MKKALLFIRALFYKIPVDKQLHYAYGYRICIMTFFLILCVPMLRNTLRVYEMLIISSIIAGFFAAILKEFLDGSTVARQNSDNLTFKSGFDWADLKVTVLGSLEAGLWIFFCLYSLYWSGTALPFK